MARGGCSNPTMAVKLRVAWLRALSDGESLLEGGKGRRRGSGCYLWAELTWGPSQTRRNERGVDNGGGGLRLGHEQEEEGDSNTVAPPASERKERRSAATG